MPPALLIIADDLTGANDTGVQFAKQGLRVLVSIHHQQPLAAFASDCDVLVVNTESRHITPEAAFYRVSQAAEQGVALGIPQFYKKTDSTLRGNVGSELAALLTATAGHELFFAPAYPKLQRITRQGVQFVAGLPLSQSTFATDLLNPLREDFIPALIAEQTNLSVKLFDSLPAETNTQTIYVLDAETDVELRSAAQLLKGKKLLAGSAGLAEYLPEVMQLPTTPAPLPSLSEPMLVVNGSLHEMSRRQVMYAAHHGWAVIEATPEIAPEQIVTALATNRRAIITTAPQHYDERFATHLAKLVQQVLGQISVPTLVVFGGDTLAAIAEAIGWTAFRPQVEFRPGIPFVKVCGQDALCVLTKAGSFGAEDLLAKFNYD